MSSFGALDVGYTGLVAHRKRMDVISANIANASTPGYSRQRVSLSPVGGSGIGLFSGSRIAGGGVEVSTVTRMRSEVLADHARQQNGLAAVRSKRAEILSRVEEAVGGLQEGGLHDQMTALWNAFDDLANSPDDLAIRNIVLQRADALAQGFTRTTDALDRLRQQEIDGMAATIDEVNVLSEAIAALDSQILGTVNSDSPPNSLLDDRDRKVDQLAQLIDLDVVDTPEGQVTLSVDGELIVSNGRSTPLQLQISLDPALAPLGYDKVAVVNQAGRELRIATGELGASLDTVMDTIPTERRNMDDLLSQVATQTNTIHTTGVGLDGSTGLNLFEIGASPGELLVSADVAGQPEKLAAAAVGAGAFDDTVARQLANLAERPDGPSRALTDVVGSLASRVATAAASAQAAEAAASHAEAQALAVSGVSLDQELTDLISAQRAFEASARIVTTIDQMLNTLINATGLVGRA